MPSYPANAQVHTGDWDASSDAHPAMNFMRQYTNRYDQGNAESMFGDWTTEDFTYAKSTGQVFPAGKASLDAVIADYSFFTKYYHEPYFFVYWERENGDGWEMSGNAWLYANLPGGSGKGIKDDKGRDWEMRVPGGFYFVYRKDPSSKHDGIKTASFSITSDSGPVVVELLKRGVMTPKDLGL